MGKIFDSIELNGTTYSLGATGVIGTTESDFDISDSEGNVVARFSDGHLKTKNFDSKNVLPSTTSTVWKDTARNLSYNSILVSGGVRTAESNGVRNKVTAGGSDNWVAYGFVLPAKFIYGHTYYVAISMELIDDSKAPTEGSTQGNMSYSTLDFRDNYNSNTIVSKTVTALNSIVTKGNTGDLRYVVEMNESGSYTSPCQMRLQLGQYGGSHSGEWKIKAVCVVDMTALQIASSKAEELFATYKYNHADVVKTVYDITVAKAVESEASGSSSSGGYNGAIEIWGDSLVAQGYGSYIASALGRTVITKGYGGKTSTYIRDQFLANADVNKSIIICAGRNNYDKYQEVLNDIKTMVGKISHNRFLICTVANGNYNEGVGTGAYNTITKLNDKILRMYPANSLDTRGATIEEYDMSVELKESFVQPAVGGEVTIKVSDAAFLTTYNSHDLVGQYWGGEASMKKIAIGFSFDKMDIYKVISSDATANTMVVQLETNGSGIASGSNVGSVAESGSASKRTIMVMQYADYYCYINDITQSTFRSDGIHMSEAGKKCLAKVIVRKINQMNL